jgi:hypothetical protein
MHQIGLLLKQVWIQKVIDEESDEALAAKRFC